MFPRKTSKAIDFPYLKIGDCSIPDKTSLEEMITSSEPNLHLVKLENSFVSSGASTYTKRSRCRTISLGFFFSCLLNDISVSGGVKSLSPTCREADSNLDMTTFYILKTNQEKIAANEYFPNHWGRR